MCWFKNNKQNNDDKFNIYYINNSKGIVKILASKGEDTRIGNHSRGCWWRSGPSPFVHNAHSIYQYVYKYINTAFAMTTPKGQWSRR